MAGILKMQELFTGYGTYGCDNTVRRQTPKNQVWFLQKHKVGIARYVPAENLFSEKHDCCV